MPSSINRSNYGQNDDESPKNFSKTKLNEVTFEESNDSLSNSIAIDFEKSSPRKRNFSESSASSNKCSNNVTNRTIRAPDGGWGWVIVFSSFMINLIADGVSLSFGLIFVELVDHFGQSKSKTAWVGSLFLSIPLITGPIASALTDRFGCRRIAITGAILSSFGFLIGYFSYQLEHLFIAFSISGFGLALCYVTSIVIVAYYFEKRRSLATGLAVCGTGFGTFLFAPLTTYLLEEYNWRGTLLILSGIFLNIAVFGALMRDINYNDFVYDNVDREFSENDYDNFETIPLPNGKDNDLGKDDQNEKSDQYDERLCSSLVHIPTFINHRGSNQVNNEVIRELTNRKGSYLRHLMQRYPRLIGTFMNVDNESNDSHKNLQKLAATKIDNKNDNEMTKPLNKMNGKRERFNDGFMKNHLFFQIDSSAPFSNHYLRNLKLQRGSLTYRGAMLNIRKYRLKASSAPDIYRNSMVTIVEERSCSIIYDLKEIIVDMFDLSLFKSFHYSLFCLSNFLLYVWVDIPYVYLPDQAINFGSADKESSSFLISLIGILNTFGVVFVGYIGDKTWIDSSLLYSVFIATSGLSMAVIPWVYSYLGTALLASLYGFTISANYALVSVILVNIISLDAFTSGYGLLLLIQGFGSLIGPPIAGWLYDISGSYDSSFYVTGICIFISGALVAPIAKAKTCVNLEENSSITTESSRPCSPMKNETSTTILYDEINLEQKSGDKTDDKNGDLTVKEFDYEIDKL